MLSLSGSAVLLLTLASAQSKTLTIVSILSKPYLEYVDGTTYKGFIPDLLDVIALEEPFSYKIVLSPDGKWGSPRDGKWDGMVGMVANKEADLVAADLSTTQRRMEVLDFSLPFLTSGVTILMRSPGTSWKLHSGDHGPIATPALAANPTTVEQVLNLTDTRFGCVQGGSTLYRMQTGKHLVHQAINSNIEQHNQQNLVANNREGIEKVKNERGYGFLIEKTSADYAVGKDESCSLYTVGNLGSYGYGFGFPKGSALREMFSRGILKVSSNGSLYSIIKKWFPENQNCFSSRISAAAGSP